MYVNLVDILTQLVLSVRQRVEEKLAQRKKNMGGAKQAGGQATEPKGTQVKSLSASASGPSDKDAQKSASASGPSDKDAQKSASASGPSDKDTQQKSASASGPTDKDTQK